MQSNFNKTKNIFFIYLFKPLSILGLPNFVGLELGNFVPELLQGSVFGLIFGSEVLEQLQGVYDLGHEVRYGVGAIGVDELFALLADLGRYVVDVDDRNLRRLVLILHRGCYSRTVQGSQVQWHLILRAMKPAFNPARALWKI